MVIVEDELEILDFTRFVLEREGYDWLREKYPEAARDEDEMEQQHAASSGQLTF